MSKRQSFFKRLKNKIKSKRQRLMSCVAKFIVRAGWDEKAAGMGLFTPKVVKYMDGGLASQMVMFAKGYHYAKKRNLPLYLDNDWFRRCGKDINGVQNRPFHLFESFPEIKKAYGDKVIRSSTLFQFLFTDATPDAAKEENLPPRSLYLKRYGGEYACMIKHVDALKELFRYGTELNEEENRLSQDILSSNSCALHIRKGNFVGTVHDVCSDKYYTDAIVWMQKEVPDCVFYVFTNDDAYARALAATTEGNFVFLTNRSETHPCADMMLMQQCKHAIISNSGFSLVPAILSYSPKKKVIMPKYWRNMKHKSKARHRHNLPGWVCLEC